MIIYKIKKLSSPLFLLFYLLFAQVYPYVHMHIHQESEKQEIELTFHPIKECEHDHEGTETHDHEHANHVHGNWDHAVRKERFNNEKNDAFYVAETPLLYDPSLNYSILNLPPSDILPNIYFTNLSSRAPPAFC